MPRRSAERRGRPQADARGNADRPWRSPHWPRTRMRSSEVQVRILPLRQSALRLPLFFGGKAFVQWLSKPRAQKTRRENDLTYPPPAIVGGGGPRVARRRGRGTRRFSFGAGVSSPPAPPPPHCCRSAVPLP